MSIVEQAFYQSLLCQPAAQTPVWLLRQAGRYLPEYLELRKKSKNFMDFCKTPALAAEATLQPITRFGFDAAIIFSDILTIPDAMGCPVTFVENEGPVLTHPIQSDADVDALRIPDPHSDLSYVLEAIDRVKSQLSIPLIGFSGSPWTLACYMLEGRSNSGFPKAMQCLYQHPERLKALLTRLSEACAAYLHAQIVAGADVVMLFDSWGGILSTPDYHEYSLAFMQQVLRQLPREHAGKRIPRIIFTKGGGLWLESIAQAGCDAIALDWTVNLPDARTRVGAHIALQGNIDPLLLLHGNPESIRRRVMTLLESQHDHPGFILNAGHGVLPQTPLENVAAFVNAAREYRLYG